MASIQHLTSSQSDHKLLLLSLGQGNQRLQHGRIFRYEIMWEREESLGTVIEKAWLKKHPGSDLGAIAESLKTVMGDLKHWSKNTFGSVTRQLENLRGELERLEKVDPVGIERASWPQSGS